MRWLLPFLLVLPLRLWACDLALVFAVDISGSVDDAEYAIQMRGIANGLRDGVVAEALVRGKARIALVEWTGASRQELLLPWTEVTGFAALEDLALRIERTPRAWRNFATAIGQALEFTLPMMNEAADCERRVIDVSGDGRSNEGLEPSSMHPALAAAGVTVNALVIEGAEEDIVPYYWENVITGSGAFVVIANGYQEYARRMREKLLREVAPVVSLVTPQPEAPRITEN